MFESTKKGLALIWLFFNILGASPKKILKDNQT